MGAIEGGTGRALVLTAALLGATGCGSVGEILQQTRAPSARATVIDGEIREVDARRGRIRVRSMRHGTRTVRVDRSTRVLYRRVEYTLEALEPGDVVRVFVEVDRNGAPWASRVDVRASVDERRHSNRQARPREYAWLDGTVARMDRNEGWFTVSVRRAGEIVVWVPDDLDRDDERRLGRMRRGDQVRIEVRPITSDEAELVGFRS
jgi:hypothetical protein